MKKLIGVLMAAVMALGCGSFAFAGETEAAEETAVYESTPDPLPDAEYVIRYAFTSPYESQVGKIAQGYKDRVEALSGGRITCEFYPDAQLGDKLANMESLRTGDLEMCDANAADFSGYNGRWSVFSFPYNYDNAREMVDVCRSDEVYSLLDADLTAAGFKCISFCDFGSRNVFANKAIRNPEDAKGVKIRVMQDPILAKTMEYMGFSAITLGWSEVYTAMQQGTIDALEQNEALCVDNFLYEVASVYSYTGQFRIPGLQYMSLKFYDSLPEDLQEAVIQAGIENEEYLIEWFPEYNQAAIDTLKEKGVEFVEDVDLDAFKEAVAGIPDYYFSLEDTPDDAEELYNAMQTALKEVREAS